MANGLSKFGVFSGPNQVERTMKMPKPKYRFRVDFINFGGVVGGKNVTLETLTSGRPTRSFEEQAVHGYNSVAYYPGKPTWEPIEIQVKDAYDNSVEKEINRQLQSQFDAYNQVSATVASNCKFTTNIVTLDGHGATTERWELSGCFLQNANHDGFDYSSSEAQTITMSIRFDNALLYDADGTLVSGGGNVSTFMDNVGLTG